MTVKKHELNEIFDTARQFGYKFVFLGIVAEGTREVIAIPTFSFDKKQEFYNKAYSDDLVHHMNSSVYVEWVATDDKIDIAHELWEMLDRNEDYDNE